MMQSVIQDLRYAVRTLRAKPAFTAAALLTLALGIGANTAIFSVVHAVLIRDLPYPEPDRLVQVYETNRRFGFDHGVVNPFNFDTWQREATSFSLLAPLRSTAATVTGLGDAERVRAALVDPAFFTVLNVPPAAGRVFTTAEAEAASQVVVISDEAWRARFGSAPDTVGRTVTINDEPWTVIGIMPPEVKVPQTVELWMPLSLGPTERANMRSWYLGVIGRLRPGVTLTQAQQELDRISARLEEQFPESRTDRGAAVFNLQEDLTARVVSGLTVLQTVVVAVLLIACANIANLQLAQASARAREFAVRAAVGAHRGRLIRQLITENVLLSAGGGAVGILMAAIGVRALLAAAPPNLLPTFAAVSISWPVLGFTMGLALVCGVLFGVAPALMYSRPRLVDTLRDDSQGASGTGNRLQRWMRSGLIVAEVALAFTLFFGAALLVRSFVTLMRQDPGFRTEQLVSATLTLPARYETPEAQLGFWRDLMDRIAAVPGVTAVAGSTALPFSNWEWQTNFELADMPDLQHDGAGIRSVTPGYFSQLGIPIHTGREFSVDDHSTSDPVVIVNDVFARRYVSGESIVGQRIRTDLRNGPWLTIIGVAGSTRHTRLSEDPGPELYRPLAQKPEFLLSLAVRSAGSVDIATAAIAQAARDLDSAVPVGRIRAMDVMVGDTVAERRFHLVLLTSFAVLAATLALIGIYGVTTYVVGLRRREVGIRVALGASPASVRALIFRVGLRPVLTGLALGVGGAVAGARLIESQLFGVTASDPLTMASAGLAFVVAGVMACLAPARTGTRINPIEVLRS
jgi:putative ABC transport system permease protein